MRILVVGAGYVGAATAVTLAELGHEVICTDIDHEKIQSFRRGTPPFYEPDLAEVLLRQLNNGNLTFETFPLKLVPVPEIIFICVGTPPLDQGQADLSQLDGAVAGLEREGLLPDILVIKSTVPVGTGTRLQEKLIAGGHGHCKVVVNPEFLREGSAVFDTLHPDRIVLGCDDQSLSPFFDELYRGITAPFVWLCREEAELVKYASNSFLAVKISYINEIARMCDLWKLDVNKVAQGVALDHRIGPHFLAAGLGYGGSCLPKDVASLLYQAREAGETASLLQAAQEVNISQRRYLVEKVNHALGGVAGKKIALWGLTFKPNTDDLRDSPALDVASQLISMGGVVKAYDPALISQRHLISPGVLAGTALDALEGAEVLVVLTDWPEFSQVDWNAACAIVARPLVVDGRNCLDPAELQEAGWDYMGIGR